AGFHRPGDTTMSHVEPTPRPTTIGTATGTPTFSLEVITPPVSDVDQALRFYVEQVGFTLDVDYAPKDSFRVAQLTPPGSRCSIQFGIGLTDASAGCLGTSYASSAISRRHGVGSSNKGSRSAKSVTRRRSEPGMEASRREPTRRVATTPA